MTFDRERFEKELRENYVETFDWKKRLDNKYKLASNEKRKPKNIPKFYVSANREAFPFNEYSNIDEPKHGKRPLPKIGYPYKIEFHENIKR